MGEGLPEPPTSPRVKVRGVANISEIGLGSNPCSWTWLLYHAGRTAVPGGVQDLFLGRCTRSFARRLQLLLRPLHRLCSLPTSLPRRSDHDIPFLPRSTRAIRSADFDRERRRLDARHGARDRPTPSLRFFCQSQPPFEPARPKRDISSRAPLLHCPLPFLPPHDGAPSPLDVRCRAQRLGQGLVERYDARGGQHGRVLESDCRVAEGAPRRLLFSATQADEASYAASLTLASLPPLGSPGWRRPAREHDPLHGEQLFDAWVLAELAPQLQHVGGQVRQSFSPSRLDRK